MSLINNNVDCYRVIFITASLLAKTFEQPKTSDLSLAMIPILHGASHINLSHSVFRLATPLPALNSDIEHFIGLKDKAYLIICRSLLIIIIMKSIILIALAAMLAIANTEAHPTESYDTCGPSVTICPPTWH